MDTHDSVSSESTDCRVHFRFARNTGTVASSILGLADTTNVLMTNVTNSNDSSVWPEQNLVTSGAYGLSYFMRDVCGRTAMATGSLDLRCNNPPVPLIKSPTTQSYTVQLGQVCASPNMLISL
jgi:hypothetical protein